MTSTWIIVANKAAARILDLNSLSGQLTEIESIAHPEGRLLAHELKSDLPGRAFDSGGLGRHAMENEVGPREKVAIDFAMKLAERLERARIHMEAERFVVAAAPEFLGLLRKALSAEAQRLVVLEVNRDLVKLSPQQIREHLPEFFATMLA